MRKLLPLSLCLLVLTLPVFAQGQPPAEKPAPTPAPTAPAKKTDTAPLAKQSIYPMQPQDAADFAALSNQVEAARQNLMAAADKVLTCRFDAASVLEAVGQMREANGAVAAARQRQEQWVLAKRPADCAECVISQDGKYWQRQATAPTK